MEFSVQTFSSIKFTVRHDIDYSRHEIDYNGGIFWSISNEINCFDEIRIFSSRWYRWTIVMSLKVNPLFKSNHDGFVTSKIISYYFFGNYKRYVRTSWLYEVTLYFFKWIVLRISHYNFQNNKHDDIWNDWNNERTIAKWINKLSAKICRVIYRIVSTGSWLTIKLYLLQNPKFSLNES